MLVAAADPPAPLGACNFLSPGRALGVAPLLRPVLRADRPPSFVGHVFLLDGTRELASRALGSPLPLGFFSSARHLGALTLPPPRPDRGSPRASPIPRDPGSGRPGLSRLLEFNPRFTPIPRVCGPVGPQSRHDVFGGVGPPPLPTFPAPPCVASPQTEPVLLRPRPLRPLVVVLTRRGPSSLDAHRRRHC